MARNEVERPFWRQVEEERRQIAALLAKREAGGQPAYSDDNLIQDLMDPRKVQDNNVVYITSIRHNKSGTRPGFVVLTTVYLAGQRLAEQTHELSTPEQIDAYQRGQALERDSIQKAGAEAGFRQFAQTVGRLGGAVPPPPEPAKESARAAKQ